MQKIFLFHILFIVMSIVMPVECMDQTSSKKTIIIELHLSEVNAKHCIDLENFDFNDKKNKHICSVLGIEWKNEDNSKYFVRKALFKNQECLGECWTKTHPQFLPLSKLPNPMSNVKSDFKVKAPSRLPSAFVTELKTKKSVTLAPNNFQEPVTIIFELVYTKKCLSDKDGLIECVNESIKGLEEILDGMQERIGIDDLVRQVIHQKLNRNIGLLYILNVGMVSIGVLTLLFGFSLKYFCLLQLLLSGAMLCL